VQAAKAGLNESPCWSRDIGIEPPDSRAPGSCPRIGLGSISSKGPRLLLRLARQLPRLSIRLALRHVLPEQHRRARYCARSAMIGSTLDARTYGGVDAHKKDLFIAMLVGDGQTPVTWQLPNNRRADCRPTPYRMRVAHLGIRPAKDHAPDHLTSPDARRKCRVPLRVTPPTEGNNGVGLPGPAQPVHGGLRRSVNRGPRRSNVLISPARPKRRTASRISKNCRRAATRISRNSLE